MCVSLHPASFKNTILYSGEAKVDGKVIHVLGYQNEAKSYVSGGNAMIIPIPSKSKMTRDNIIDTSNAKDILQDMKAFIPTPKFLSADSFSFNSKGIEIFDNGMYTVVLAESAKDIPDVLSLVPEDKRPNINKSIFEAYEVWYPGYTFALFCWGNTNDLIADPILIWYDPIDSKHLFAPMLDAHDGKVPNLNELVYRDHTIILGSYRMENNKTGIEVTYSEHDSSVTKYLPKRITGFNVKFETKNGDGRFPLNDGRPSFGRLETISSPPHGVR